MRPAAPLYPLSVRALVPGFEHQLPVSLPALVQALQLLGVYALVESVLQTPLGRLMLPFAPAVAPVAPAAVPPAAVPVAVAVAVAPVPRHHGATRRSADSNSGLKGSPQAHKQ